MAAATLAELIDACMDGLRGQGDTRSRDRRTRRILRLLRDGRDLRPLALHPPRGHRGRAADRPAAGLRHRLRRRGLRRHGHRPRSRTRSTTPPSARRSRWSPPSAPTARSSGSAPRSPTCSRSGSARAASWSGRPSPSRRSRCRSRRSRSRSRAEPELAPGLPGARLERRRPAREPARRRSSASTRMPAIEVIARSSVYETEPVGEVTRSARLPQRGGARSRPTLEPLELLDALQGDRAGAGPRGRRPAPRRRGRSTWTCCCSASVDARVGAADASRIPELAQPPVRAGAAAGARAGPRAAAPVTRAARRARRAPAVGLAPRAARDRRRQHADPRRRLRRRGAGRALALLDRPRRHGRRARDGRSTTCSALRGIASTQIDGEAVSSVVPQLVSGVPRTCSSATSIARR